MRLKKTQLSLILLALMTVGGASAVYFFGASDTSLPNEEKVVAAGQIPVVPLEETFPFIITPNTTLFSALRELNIPPATIQQIVDAAKPVHNLAQIHPGIRFQVFRETTDAKDEDAETPINGIQFHFSALEQLDIRKIENVWTAKKIIEQVDLKTVTFTGTVTSSLWESAVQAKMDPDLISELADIFGWEVDFSREVRANDRWRISVEQKIVKGNPIGWGAILAAEYVNAGVPFQAVLYRLKGEDMGYYSPKGGSLRKMFLKSPIRYARITSRFNKKRFHPILQIIRPHQGVDYGASIGTPVRVVGDGTVVMAQRSGGGGNVVKVRHNATYQTAYKHLKGFAPGVRNGARVRQGQVVGYVGNTGMSTGPHLHFEFYQNGAYVDPLKKSFPSAEPVPQNHLVEFQKSAEILLTSLPNYEISDRLPAATPAPLVQ